jgi:hypothetical protein
MLCMLISAAAWGLLISACTQTLERSTLTMKSARRVLEQEMDLGEKALDPHKQMVERLVQEVRAFSARSARSHHVARVNSPPLVLLPRSWCCKTWIHLPRQRSSRLRRRPNLLSSRPPSQSRRRARARRCVFARRRPTLHGSRGGQKIKMRLMLGTHTLLAAPSGRGGGGGGGGWIRQ